MKQESSKFKTFVKSIPLSTPGLSLSFANMGNLFYSISPAMRDICGIVSLLIFILVLVRVMGDIQGVRKELKESFALASFPTVFMTIMVLSTLIPANGTLGIPFAFGLWLLGLILHLLTLVWFIVMHIVRLDSRVIAPNWYVMFVGFVTGAITSPAHSMQSVGKVILYVGIVGYVLCSVLIVYRLYAHGMVSNEKLPSVAVMISPSCLLLIAYMNVFEIKMLEIVIVFVVLLVIGFIFFLVYLDRIVRVKFHPGFTSLCFPTAILASSVKALVQYYSSITGVALDSMVWISFGILSLAISTIVLTRIVLSCFSLRA